MQAAAALATCRRWWPCPRAGGGGPSHAQVVAALATHKRQPWPHAGDRLGNVKATACMLPRLTCCGGVHAASERILRRRACFCGGAHAAAAAWPCTGGVGLGSHRRRWPGRAGGVDLGPRRRRWPGHAQVTVAWPRTGDGGLAARRQGVLVAHRRRRLRQRPGGAQAVVAWSCADGGVLVARRWRRRGRVHAAVSWLHAGGSGLATCKWRWLGRAQASVA